MFGLTKREQRWKAEQQAAEAVLGLTSTLVKTVAEIRVAEARADASELERLRTENKELRELLQQYRGELNV